MEDYFYLKVLSYVIGWIYFFAWSLSFYPQGLLNWKKKSVAGFSLEFAILNVSGYIFYSMYSTGGKIYPHLGTGIIQNNDLVFAIHAFFLASTHLSQVFIYDRGKQTTFQPWAIYLLVTLWTCVLTTFMLEGIMGVNEIPKSVNTFKMAGYGKAIITFSKYCPQVYLNWKRKSTVGWSMFNVMCDLTGGTFSIIQQIIDMIYHGKTKGDWSFFGSNTGTFNIVKFFLGVITIGFDLTFIVQHYILYPHKEEEKKDEIEFNKINKSPLLK
mmetsp:Transcript_2015/g.1813  ORF Transcript_2015/g.1813 Transcript_2015/m.1813 type:complete len:269 (+) Transcript_2015:17-823(+)